MTERVFLHVGAPKSGTTYLQRVLEANRAALAERGVLVVGERHLDRVHAAMAVREDPRLDSLPPEASEAWQRLVAEVRAWAGPDAVLSYELFAGASAEQAERALADLAGLEVHVVITARDLAAAVPSAWQERLKFALTTPLESWRPRPESAGARAEWGWRTMDPAGVATRWGASLPPERVHVVTVPRSTADRTELWRRFAEACGLPVEGLALAPEAANESLGVVASELLRRVNVQLGDRISGNRQQALWLRDTLAHGVLAGLGRERIGLTDAQHAEAAERASAATEAVRAAGYAVHGDLDDVLAERVEGRTPGQATEAELLEAATETIAQLLLLVRERTRERDAARRHQEPPAGARGLAGGLVRRVTAPRVEGRTAQLRARVAALEAEVERSRALHLRVGELTDVVTELLLPRRDQDDRITAQALHDYRDRSL